MKPAMAIKLRQVLENHHVEFVKSHAIEGDAIAPALQFKDPRDQEMVAFICAVVAYGKVAHIQSSIRKLIAPMGVHPVDWLTRSSTLEIRNSVKGWNHRFNTEKDAYFLLLSLRQIYQNWRNMESFIDPLPGQNSFEVIERFINKLMQLDLSPENGLPKKGSSFWFFLPHPDAGSACKRLNLFLRWMVGKGEMDLSLWSKMHTRDLIIPVDTHLLKQARSLGFTKRKQADRKTAVEITKKLSLLDPDDPTRFDFVLCHLGIRGHILRRGLETLSQ